MAEKHQLYLKVMIVVTCIYVTEGIFSVVLMLTSHGVSIHIFPNLNELRETQRILDKLDGIGLQIAQANRLIKRGHVVVDILI